jgi:hypothetical protein
MLLMLLIIIANVGNPTIGNEIGIPLVTGFVLLD